MAEAGTRKGGPRTKAQWDTSAPFTKFSSHRYTPNVGLVIEDVDLANIDDDTIAEIRRAVAENCVVFFRNQQLTVEEHIAFGRRFGELDVHPAAANATGHPEILVISADENSDRANGEAWHSDVSCQPEPPMGSISTFTKFRRVVATPCFPTCMPHTTHSVTG